MNRFSKLKFRSSRRLLMAQAGAGCAFLGLSARGTSRTSLQGRIYGVSQKGAPRFGSRNWTPKLESKNTSLFVVVALGLTAVPALAGQAAVADRDDSIVPGVYAWFNGASTNSHTEVRIALKCTKSPHIHYPDGFMANKALNTAAGNAGGKPYEYRGHGQCRFTGGQMTCDVIWGAPGGKGRSGKREAEYVVSREGHIILSRLGGDVIGRYIPCDLKELDQVVEDGRNVLDEIVRREDGGPLPKLSRGSGDTH